MLELEGGDGGDGGDDIGKEAKYQKRKKKKLKKQKLKALENMELLFAVKKFGKGQAGRWEPDGQGATYIESSLFHRPYFQQGLIHLVIGTATDTYMRAEAGTWGDVGRRVSSFGKRA